MSGNDMTFQQAVAFKNNINNVAGLSVKFLMTYKGGS